MQTIEVILMFMWSILWLITITEWWQLQSMLNIKLFVNIDLELCQFENYT